MHRIDGGTDTHIQNASFTVVTVSDLPSHRTPTAHAECSTKRLPTTVSGSRRHDPDVYFTRALALRVASQLSGGSATSCCSIVQILTKWYEVRKESPLPIVIPLVTNHGSRRWKSSTEFMELFGNVPKPLRPYVTSCRHALVDLTAFKQGPISTNPRLNSYLMAMKFGSRRDLEKHLGVILVREITNMDLLTIIRYFNAGKARVSLESIRTALNSLDNNRGKIIMGQLFHEFVEQGRVEGHVEGKADLLVRLLKNRFGRRSAKYRKKVLAADVPTIERWFDLATAATDLRHVFKI